MRGFTTFTARCAATMLLVLAAAAMAAAGTVSGVIHNGTNEGKPAAGVDVILIQLQGGMEPVAQTKSDASGHYLLSNPAIGQGPMLIRAVYKGVMFHQPLTPGTPTVDVTVYDPTADAKSVTVGSRLIVFQPNGGKLLVGEEYALQNQTQPPVAYYNEKGNFDFSIPDGANLSQVSSWGPAGMPVVQGTINRGSNKFAIAYAFQPGDNGVRLSYEVPYGGDHASLHFTNDHAVQRVMLVAPPSVQVTSPGFMPAGTEQGFNVYTRDAVPQGAMFDVALSGTAPMPTSDQGGGAGDASGAPDQSQATAQGQDQVNGRAPSGPTIQAIPGRLDSQTWVIVGGIAALFALGLVMLLRRPQMAVAGGAGEVLAVPPTAARAKVASTPTAPTTAGQAAAEVDRKVEQGLEGLKDKLFRLELRRQAGTISEEEYAQERALTEKILRELVQG